MMMMTTTRRGRFSSGTSDNKDDYEAESSVNNSKGGWTDVVFGRELICAVQRGILCP